jgi:hypothetical protein
MFLLMTSSEQLSASHHERAAPELSEDASRWMPPRVKDAIVVHSRAADSEDRGDAGV